MNVVAEHFKALQDGTAFAVGGIGASAYADGWTPILGTTPNTVTYNGNRNYDLVFNSVDLSSTVSPGQRLKLTRTVAAPNQCTSLNGTTQYYSRASASLGTSFSFTDDFVVSAWVKLSSYAEGSIASRYNGTSGWGLRIFSDGRIILSGYNGGAANYSEIISYASVPLNKWVHVTAQLDMSAFTATTTTSYIMIDGTDVGATVSRGGTNPTTLVQAGNLEIGSRNGGLLPFPGKLAQVAIYSAKVTQANIRASISQGLAGTETSLISAYSFNNSINDLNTTNANNLTANGSAVATNADSPYANAVTAGLQEYAEINSVTFSTNTTVNVRVPDTCLIPTSGGVSNVYYAVGANPTGLPVFTNILAMSILSTFTSTSNARVEIPGGKISITVPVGRAIKLSAYTKSVSGTSGDNVSFEIHDGSVSGTTNLIQGADIAAMPVIGPSIYLETIERPNTSITATASKTYVLGAINNTAARSFSIAGDFTSTYRRPIFIKAELV